MMSLDRCRRAAITSALFDGPLRKKWDTLTAAKLFPAIGKLKNYFEIIYSIAHQNDAPSTRGEQKNSSHYFDYHRSRTPYLEASLVAKNSPDNLFIEVELPIIKGKITGIDELCSKYKEVLDRIVAKPQLMHFLKDTKSFEMQLHYKPNSFSNSTALTLMQRRMNKTLKDNTSKYDFGKSVYIKMTDSRKLSRNISEWFLLPNEQIFLYYYCGLTLLDFDEKYISSVSKIDRSYICSIIPWNKFGKSKNSWLGY